MNPIDETTLPRDDDQQLDRLVDGELSEADRRAVLSQLDREPDGWRRCALAFLQAQCWKKELGAIVRPPPGEPVAPQKPPPTRYVWQQRVATVLAMAATFLIALVIGTHLHWGRPAATTTPDDRPSIGDVASADNPAEKLAATPRANPKMPNTVPVRDQRPPTTLVSSPWEMVTLTAPGGPQEKSRTITLPAVKRDRLDEAWLQNLPTALPPHVLEALKGMGHEVRVRRELVPVEMKDGRRLVVPVDHVELRLVGEPEL
jgi:hypothetical protein